MAKREEIWEKGHESPEDAQRSLEASGFTVGGEPQMLGRQGQADPNDDLETDRSVKTADMSSAAEDADTALARFGKLGRGPKFSSLQGGGKTALPTGEANTRENRKPVGRSKD